MQLHFFYSFLLIAFSFVPMLGQVTLLVKDLPASTPASDTLFFASSLNDWNPKSYNHQFSKDEQGLHFFKVENNGKPFEYKITRGGWEKVETNEGGWSIPNRHYISEQGAEVKLAIRGWEDKITTQATDSIEVIVTSIPKSTPEDASIYIVGNFNEWDPGHPNCKLVRQENGAFRIRIPVWEDSLIYKFTRGNWESIEGKRSGRARLNRVHLLQPNQANTVINDIQSWEDLNANPINIYTFILLLAAMQGLLLILAINTLKNNNSSANRILSLLILLISLILLARVATYDRDIFTWLPKLHVVPDYIFFLYAPLFLLYIQKLLRPDRQLGWTWWLQLLPFALHILLYLPFWLMPNYNFRLSIVNNTFQSTFMIAGGLALLFNSVYWLLARRSIDRYQKDAEHFQAHAPNIQFLNAVMALKLVGILLWLATYLIGAYAKFSASNLVWLTDATTDGAWAIFAMTAFLLGYFAMRQPELFKLPESNLQPVIEDAKTMPQPSQEQKEWMEKVSKLMLQEQVFLNPQLTLPELAEQLGTNTHHLSKVINHGFEKNFNDFVNSYRVEEFKRRALVEPYKHQTLLAIALSVGFNSKTAFNRSFKKLTHLTPREYIQQHNN